MKIVLTAITGCRNRGVEALVRSTLQGLTQSEISAQRATLLSSDSVYDTLLLGSCVNTIDDCASYFKGSYRPRLRALLSRYRPTLYPEYQSLRKAVKSADVVVASGGDVFSSDYGSSFLRRCIGPISMAQRLGVKTAFLGHSIGPFRTASDTSAWREAALRADLITLRESQSYSYVIDQLGIPPDNVHLTADTAFLLPLPPSRRIDALLRLVGLDPSTPFIAIAPSAGISTFSKLNEELHSSRLRELIDFLHFETGAHILLVPHVHDCRPHNDDRLLVSKLLDDLDFPPFAHAVLGELSAIDFKGLISRSQLIIGERMHACIAGLSSCVPTVAIGYSVKASGILADTLGSKDRSRDLLIDIQEFVGSPDAKSRILTAWNERAEISAAIGASLPEIKRRAHDNFRYLAELVEQ